MIEFGQIAEVIGLVEGEELLDLIKSRRSVRSYTDKQIPENDLKGMLNAGRWAPSPSNVQSWRFGVITDESQLSTLKNLSPGFPESASAAIAVCSDQKDLETFSGEDLVLLRAAEASMAVQNMLLYAWAKEIGTCTVTSFSPGGIAELLGLPDEILPLLLIAAGYPKSAPDPPERADLDKITFREGYD